MWKSAAMGALIAVVLVVAVVVGGLYVVRGGFSADPGDSSRVLLVFSSADEDGATVAALITIVADGQLANISPDTTVTIPGTSSSRLGEAFIYGGGAAISAALADADVPSHTAVVVVPATVWKPAVTQAGGVSVNLPGALSVYDGVRLALFRAGEQTLTATDVGAVLSATSYLSVTERDALRKDLVLKLTRAVADSKSTGSGLESDLPADTLDVWLTTDLRRAAGSQP